MADPSPDLYDELMRERFGTASALAAELTGRVPGIDNYHRPPPGSGQYADDHQRVLRRLGIALPDSPQILALLGAGEVAHVLVAAAGTRGETLCGKRGQFIAAGDDVPLCKVCRVA